MTDFINDWPDLPEGAWGQQIRHRRFYQMRVRVGGAEPKAIVAETREWVIFEAWSSEGESFGERAWRRAQFEDEFERKQG